MSCFFFAVLGWGFLRVCVTFGPKLGGSLNSFGWNWLDHFG